MSLHRYAPKRDGNEPEIRKRFAHHGWHTEQLSGAGMPDLMCFPGKPKLREVMRGTVAHHGPVLVDVKEPKGKVTPPQVKKWAALRAIGIPVYVARTEEDVDAIVAGTAKPWEPEERRGKAMAIVTADAGRRLRVAREPGAGSIRAPNRNYTPPRTKSKVMAKASAFDRSVNARLRSASVAPSRPSRTKPKADKRIGETLPTLASELFREMMKPPGHEDYDAALKRAMQAAKEAEVFAPPEEDSEAWERGERS